MSGQEPAAAAHHTNMNRTRFEERLIRNAEQAHAMCRARQVPALIGVPAYFTGHTIGTLIGGASLAANLVTGRRAR